MPKLNDLTLGNEQIGNAADMQNLPEQRGGAKPLLDPGTYRFKFPNLTTTSDCWDTMTTQQGPRLNVIFNGALALLIVQSPGGLHDGEPFETRIAANERNRARQGEPEQLASDWDYIFRDVFDFKVKPVTNLQYAQTIIKTCAGKEMTADVEWRWSCNKNKNIYVPDGQGGQTEVEGQQGCGSTYYMGGRTGVQKVKSNPDDPNSPFVYPERVICGGKDGIPCGASVRAFANLRNFRK